MPGLLDYINMPASGGGLLDGIGAWAGNNWPGTSSNASGVTIAIAAPTDAHAAGPFTSHGDVIIATPAHHPTMTRSAETCLEPGVFTPRIIVGVARTPTRTPSC